MTPLRAIALFAVLLASPALAHHSWGWTERGEFTLTGTVTAATLANPHSVLTVDVNGDSWTVELGQPWRNVEAGLSDDMLAPGAELTVEGHRSADRDQLLMMAKRIIIDGQTYEIYARRP